jgi:hypothetical protein
MIRQVELGKLKPHTKIYRAEDGVVTTLEAYPSPYGVRYRKFHNGQPVTFPASNKVYYTYEEALKAAVQRCKELIARYEERLEQLES